MKALVDEFTRITSSPDGFIVGVRLIEWSGPHTPVDRWIDLPELWRSLAEAEAARDTAIGDPRYFGTCERCGERQPRGWMHDRRTCQPCAERHLGVVH